MQLYNDDKKRLNAKFINKHLICSKCNRPMQIDDKDSWNGITTYWFVCPCKKEGTTIKTYFNDFIVFPVLITDEYGVVIKTIIKG